jgi:hypothetical protein
MVLYFAQQRRLAQLVPPPQRDAAAHIAKAVAVPAPVPLGKAQEGAGQNGPGPAGNVKGDRKMVTAYNQFVRQEKQFVLELNVSDPQRRMGMHAGERWDNMSSGESALYAQIKESQNAGLTR